MARWGIRVSKVLNTKETINEAVTTFHLDRSGFPELVPLGLPSLDRELGGLGPGACGILAAATGVGKSSTMLAAMLHSPVKVGCVSLEDGPDVVGTRLLSALTGIDSLRIRRKDLTEDELALCNKAAEDATLDHMYFTYPIAGSLQQVVTSIKALAEAGCKMIWIDYIQEIRGHGKGDRRNEVSEAMTIIHRTAAEYNCAVMVVSQFRRFGAEEKVPQIWHLKESGDLENKARIIVLCHKVKGDDPKEDRVRSRLAKSTYGGEHIVFDMVRDASGTLREAEFFDDLGDW